MRFSVLLPTRNGGEFLDNCIRSILEQNYRDMELVISDNANADQTQNVISRYQGDPRVKAVRLEHPVSVTENWNNALKHSSGDYLLMMGDDDYLLPNYFSTMERVLERNGEPDCVLYNGISYVAPGSIDNNQKSYFGKHHFQYEEMLRNEQILDADFRAGIVRDMFKFKVRIPLNMQTALISRRAAELVQGGVFQAPFPDHYALNSLLLQAKKWVFIPDHLVIVGVSPKSFGHYVYSNQQSGGMSYLGISANFPGRLPGNELTNGMHVWLNMLLENHRESLADVTVDRAGYVRRQVYAWYIQKKLGTCTLRELLARFSKLSLSDWGGLLASIFDKASWARLKRMLQSRSDNSVQAQWHGLTPVAGITDIRQFSEWLQQNNMQGL